MSFWRHFKSSFVITVIGLGLGFWIGYHDGETIQAAGNALLLTAILAVLEVSLSFDNAIVNATVIEKMPAVWQRRFITWGIVIAVFGVRLILPLAIVSIVAKISPIGALQMAIYNPHAYAQIMMSSHLVMTGFGGAFLLTVALKYFFDTNKDLHWIKLIEQPLVKLGRMESFDLGVTMIVVYVISLFLPSGAEQLQFLIAAIFGLLTYILVDGMGAMLSPKHAQRAGIATFLYLEVLDASFSFDGVIGAFALTYNLFIIMLGLGIGAMFVRSLTLYMVERKTLSTFVFLEHGAFYALTALAILMLLQTLFHVPEALIGLLGAAFIALSIFSSLKFRRNRDL
jgi:hypothetical protein